MSKRKALTRLSRCVKSILMGVEILEVAAQLWNVC